MARGFIGGLAAGGLAGLLALGTVSVMAPPDAGPELADAAPGVAPPEAAAPVPPDAPRATPDASPRPAGQAAPVAQPADAPAALAPEDQDSPAAPQPGTVATPSAPEAGPEAGALTLEGEAPVLPTPQSLAPQAPEVAEAPLAPPAAQQPPPPAAETRSADLSAPEASEEGPRLPAAEGPAPRGPGAAPVPDAPDAGAAPQVATAPAARPAPPVAAEEEEVAEAEAPAPEPEGAEVPEAESEVAEAPENEAEAAEAPESEAEVAEAPEVTETEERETAALANRPAIGTPAVSLIEREGAVTVNRPGSAEEEATEVTTPEAPALAIERFAVPFERPEEKPLMAIVLVDEGASPVSGASGIAALASFPYPLTFAVDATLPDAAERLALYRDAGYEVLAMLDLPPGAQPQDAETTFGTLLPPLEGVVGVLEAPGGSLQESRVLSDQVAEILAQEGHGWVTQPSGLNTAATLARRAGVPAAAIFRDFDSKDQTAVVIRRFLDQAAFKAGLESGVIMMGRLRPETVSALLLWGLQDRAGQVALAPISAVLLEE